MSALPRVGVVGTGSMGGQVACRLLATGHTVTVHDVRPAAASALVAAGARWAPSVRDVAAGTDVLLLSLPSHVEVADVCLGPDGALAAMPHGSHLVDLTTVSVRFVDVLAEAAGAVGVRYLAAPVSQGVDNAALGRLSVFVGGSAEDLAACRPVLASIATHIVHTGPPATAIAVKLLTNLLWFVHAAALGEALALGAKSGIELQTLREVILHSCGTSWVAEHDIPSVYSGTFDPTFTTGLCLKDLGLVAELADLHGVPLELAAVAHDTFRRAAAKYGPDSPELSVVRHVQEVTGVSLQTPGPAPG